MRILATGGTGVVGAGTVTELVRRGHTVVLFSRHAAGDARQWPAGVIARVGDVGDTESIRGAADACNVVLHMVGVVGGSDDATFADVNVGGTANMLSEAERAGVGRFVYVSSLGATRGASAYHASKREAEALVRRFRGQWTIARPGNVYGPGDEQISLLLKLVRSPSPIVPRIGDGDQPIWWNEAPGSHPMVCGSAPSLSTTGRRSGSSTGSRRSGCVASGWRTRRRSTARRHAFSPSSQITSSGRDWQCAPQPSR